LFWCAPGARAAETGVGDFDFEQADRDGDYALRWFDAGDDAFAVETLHVDRVALLECLDFFVGEWRWRRWGLTLARGARR